MITFDRSDRSCVAVCSCGWRDVATTYNRAAAASLAHVQKAHTVTAEPAYDRMRIAASRR